MTHETEAGVETPAASITPIRGDEVATLATAEYARLLDLLRSLDPGDWERPTDCAEWDVRLMVAHLLGAAESNASILELLRQTAAGRPAARRRGAPLVDGINEVQVTRRGHLTPAQLVERLAATAPKAVRGRTRTPRPLRGIKVEDGLGGKFPLGHLVDVIYTRDVWMHRVDITRATGRAMVLSAEHDGRIVADVVREWAATHGRPFALTLTGPAGGRFGHGTGGETIVIDAVEFCRSLAGRAQGEGLLATLVNF